MSIDVGMILFSTINFFIFYLIIKKFLFGKVMVIINSRKEEIENSFKKAEKEEKRANLLKSKYDENALKYENEGLKLVEKYKEKADKVYSEILEESTKEANAIKERAAKELEVERTKANKEIKQDIIKLSLEIAQKALEREIDYDKHKELINEFIAKVGS